MNDFRRLPAFVCSPYRASKVATVAEHVIYAERAMVYAFGAGFAPFAPHLHYTRVLDDSIAHEREAGMQAGQVYLMRSDRVMVFTDYGISSGMETEIDYAEAHQKEVSYHEIGRMTDKGRRVLEMTGEVFGWSVDEGETWHGGDSKTRDQALAEAVRESDGEIWPILTCACKKFTKASDLLCPFAAETLIENMAEQAFEAVGEIAAGWPVEEADKLFEALMRFVDDHVKAPIFWQAAEIERHDPEPNP